MKKKSKKIPIYVCRWCGAEFELTNGNRRTQVCPEPGCGSMDIKFSHMEEVDEEDTKGD